MQPVTSSRLASNSTILIVDDQIDNIQVLTLFLEAQGYSVTYALNAKEALNRLGVLDPDLILLDLFMPEMNGLELCKLIKSVPDQQDIPVIFLTASHAQQHVIEAFGQGAADYITKPFHSKEVLARAATHIQLRQQAIKLKHAKEQLNAIVTHVQDGLLVLDDTGVIQFANPAAVHMFRQPPDQLLGHHLGQPIVEKTLTQLEILRSNGEMGIAEITVAPIEWNGQPASIVCLRDMGDRQGAP